MVPAVVVASTAPAATPLPTSLVALPSLVFSAPASTTSSLVTFATTPPTEQPMNDAEWNWYKTKYLSKFLYWRNWEASAQEALDLPANTMVENLSRLEAFLNKQRK